MGIERKAARVLLEQGERKPIPAPFLLRLFGKKTIELTIYMPSADTCLRAVDRRLKMDIDDDEFESMSIQESLRVFSRHGKTVARVVAIAVLRTAFMDFLFGRVLAKRLLKSVPFEELNYIMEVITIEGGLGDFMHSIGLMKTMRLMKPNNPSRESQGS